MSWDKLMLEQHFAVRVLKTHRERKRMAHTYLITGEGDSLKQDLALAFAASLLEPDAVFGDDQTKSAARLLGAGHSDVLILKRQEKAAGIKIEQVREAIRWASMKPYEAPWKVLIIENAERLTLPAQNALLKTLEEPPENTVIILLVESRDHLLATIQSRSFEIRLRPGPEGPEDPQWKAVLERVGEERWEDFTENLGSGREELKAGVDALLPYFRDRMEESFVASNGIPSENWLEALDVLCETKDAIDQNVNQKLAMTRLAVHLKRLIPRKPSRATL